MYHFSTLFDKNYLPQGVALYRSLMKTAREFRLYTLCMDQASYDMILKLDQPNLVPIHLSEIENDETRAVRANTTHGQFCWVCQPLVCIYVLDKFKVDMVTYLEADSMFFSDPAVLFRELDGYSVSLVPHRYTPKFDNTERAGKYCVQFNAFRSDHEAREVLTFWKDCCYRYTKDNPGYFPGQITLDEWPGRFSCVREIEHIGAGVAPWNVQQYNIRKSNGSIYVNDVPLVFYHFHEYCRYDDGSHKLGEYPLTSGVVNTIYAAYVRELRTAKRWIQGIDPAFAYERVIKKPGSAKWLIKGSIRSLMRGKIGIYNVYRDSYFKDF